MTKDEIKAKLESVKKEYPASRREALKAFSAEYDEKFREIRAECEKNGGHEPYSNPFNVNIFLKPFIMCRWCEEHLGVEE